MLDGVSAPSSVTVPPGLSSQAPSRGAGSLTQRRSTVTCSGNIPRSHGGHIPNNTGHGPATSGTQ